MQTITLLFDPSRLTVSGNEYGQTVFKEQVAPIRQKDEVVTTIFPSNIKIVGMSFAQGFIHDIAEEYGAENVKKYLIVKSENKRVIERFEEAIKYYD